MTALSKVIRASMKYTSSSDHRVRAVKLDLSIRVFVFSITFVVSLDVSEISHVPCIVVRASMCLSEWVVVRTSSRASLE